MVRYFSTTANLNKCEETNEDTIDPDDDAVGIDKAHRHHDKNIEQISPGTKYPSRVKGLEMLQRRQQARLAVNRIPHLEPLGVQRENFYEQVRVFFAKRA